MKILAQPLVSLCLSPTVHLMWVYILSKGQPVSQMSGMSSCCATTMCNSLWQNVSSGSRAVKTGNLFVLQNKTSIFFLRIDTAVWLYPIVVCYHFNAYSTSLVSIALKKHSNSSCIILLYKGSDSTKWYDRLLCFILTENRKLFYVITSVNVFFFAVQCTGRGGAKAVFQSWLASSSCGLKSSGGIEIERVIFDKLKVLQ